MGIINRSYELKFVVEPDDAFDVEDLGDTDEQIEAALELGIYRVSLIEVDSRDDRYRNELAAVAGIVGGDSLRYPESLKQRLIDMAHLSVADVNKIETVWE